MRSIRIYSVRKNLLEYKKVSVIISDENDKFIKEKEFFIDVILIKMGR